MVKVCTEEFPKATQEDNNIKSDGFYMHENLKRQIDYYIQNVCDDWDFTIIIAGEGEVRVGKSVLAMQIGKYWQSEMKRLYNVDAPFNVNENFVFNGKDLIKQGNNLGSKSKYACLIFDEAGADLEGVKALKATTQATKDYLRECGQYNMLNILVLPEFFDLPKGIALSRSNCLINVYYIPDEDGYFRRGYFKFYSRPNKKKLFILGKPMLDYNAWKSDFYGDFKDFYTVDKKEYKEAKKKALKNRENLSRKEMRYKEFLVASIKHFINNGLTYQEIAYIINQYSSLKINEMAISRLLSDDYDYMEDLY